MSLLFLCLLTGCAEDQPWQCKVIGINDNKYLLVIDGEMLESMPSKKLTASMQKLFSAPGSLPGKPFTSTQPSEKTELGGGTPSPQTNYRPQYLPWDMSNEEFIAFIAEIRREAMSGKESAYRDAFRLTQCCDTERAGLLTDVLLDLEKNDSKRFHAVLAKEPIYIRYWVYACMNEE